MNTLQQEVERILTGARFAMTRSDIYKRCELAESPKQVSNALFRLVRAGRVEMNDNRQYRLVSGDEGNADPKHDADAPLPEFDFWLAPELQTDAVADTEPLPVAAREDAPQAQAEEVPDLPTQDPLEALLRANAQSARQALSEYAAQQTDPVLSALKQGFDAATAALNSYLRRELR